MCCHRAAQSSTTVLANIISASIQLGSFNRVMLFNFKVNLFHLRDVRPAIVATTKERKTSRKASEIKTR